MAKKYTARSFANTTGMMGDVRGRRCSTTRGGGRGGDHGLKIKLCLCT